MTKQHFASAHPRKHFFLEMFTRDISLEACVLDLIDNSIDGLIRSHKLDISNELLKERPTLSERERSKLPVVNVSFKPNEFTIEDTCGGIDRDYAETEVFTFGHSPEQAGGHLGVYGIGLKRAIFKLGNMFNMRSQTATHGFTAALNVREWSAKDEALTDWRIPIGYTGGSGSLAKSGTQINITELRPEVCLRLGDGVFASRMHTAIAQTYAFFLERYVRVVFNGNTVEPELIPIAQSDAVSPAKESYSDGDVEVLLIASLQTRAGKNQEWRMESAGWYVACNGRIVLTSNKTEETGWSTFHSKYRGFVGLAMFHSKNAMSLPWTTTKRGINRESPVYLQARGKMKLLATPIISFLDRMYASEPPEELGEREIAESVKPVDIRSLADKPSATFQARAIKPRPPKSTVRISYEAEMSDVDAIRQHLKKPSLTPNRVGQYTFDYYLKAEAIK